MKPIYLTLVVFFVALSVLAQKNESTQKEDYLKKRWGHVATRMPDSWYGTDEAKQVAENVLVWQKNLGGWEKNKNFHHTLSKTEKKKIVQRKSEKGGTFDNRATITELRFLAKVYSHVHNERYKKAFIKGLKYIFMAQYNNGGWPQFYPVRDPETEYRIDKTLPYSGHITYNDNAMVNIMSFLSKIASGDSEFASLGITENLKAKAQEAFNNGVNCILKTQIVVNGKPTVWCAQHDEITLAPANARSYELASFSGSESVNIVKLLMTIENPSKEIVSAVEGAVNWFENHKVEGIRVKTIRTNGEKDRIVVQDSAAPSLWGRFYDLETEKPFFCDRDGIKKNSLAEIGINRRGGYSWYTSAPAKLLEQYPDWKKTLGKL